MAQSPPVTNPAPPDVSGVEQAHVQTLTDKTIQFQHVTNAIIEQKPPPKWLEAIGKFLVEISPAIGYIFWAALILLLAFLAYYVMTEILGIRFFQPKAKVVTVEPPPQWQPNEREARNLLAAADALAAEGKFEEAVHLILLRSIEDIDRFRPLVVRPALTTRDIAQIEAIPDRARPAFQVIAEAVERTLFAGGRINKDEFGQCRQAYAGFALPTGWQA
jgi:hypothetical protein